MFEINFKPRRAAASPPINKPSSHQDLPADSPPGSPGSDRTYRPDSPSAASDAGTILPSSYWKTTDFPEDDSGSESNWSSDADSYTSSLNASLLAYRTINGRRYHAERGNASYWCANDEQQLESMDFYAHLARISIGGVLHKAPLEKDTLRKAIDIGTGTGIWAIDFAEEYPDCEVIGTDISPSQPGWVPPNVTFEIEDCSQEWTFDSDSFDFVHMRLLYGSIPDWDALFAEAYRVCKPGGWIESHEASPDLECDDGSVPPNSAIAQWGKFYFEGGRKTGQTFEVLQNDIQIKAMKSLGMESVQVMDVKAPVGDWPQDPTLNEIGRAAQATLEKDYEGYLSLLAKLVEDWDEADVAIYCEHLRREVRNTKYHSYFRQRVVWGRKPLNAPHKESGSSGKGSPEERSPRDSSPEENSPEKGSPESDSSKQDFLENDSTKQGSPERDSHRQDSSRQSSPEKDSHKQDSSRQSSPEKDSPKQDSSRQTSPRQSSPGKDSPKQDSPETNSPRKDSQEQGSPEPE